MDISNPSEVKAANHGSCSNETPPKLPIPQTM